MDCYSSSWLSRRNSFIGLYRLPGGREVEAEKALEIKNRHAKHEADEQHGARGGNCMHQTRRQRAAKHGLVDCEENVPAVEQGSGQEIEHGQRQVDEDGELEASRDSAIPNLVPPAAGDADRAAETADAHTRLFVVKQRVVCVTKHLYNLQELGPGRRPGTNHVEIHPVLQFDTDAPHVLLRIKAWRGCDHKGFAFAHDSQIDRLLCLLADEIDQLLSGRN